MKALKQVCVVVAATVLAMLGSTVGAYAWPTGCPCFIGVPPDEIPCQVSGTVVHQAPYVVEDVPLNGIHFDASLDAMMTNCPSTCAIALQYSADIDPPGSWSGFGDVVLVPHTTRIEEALYVNIDVTASLEEDVYNARFFARIVNLDDDPNCWTDWGGEIFNYDVFLYVPAP